MKNNSMTINFKKCGMFKLHKNNGDEMKVEINKQLIEKFPNVSNYKYLG